MQNKTPILVLTGLAIVAAAAIAGLTRDRWMGEPTPPATTVTAEAPATAEQPAAPEAPKTTEQTAATEAPAATEQAAAPEQAAATPETAAPAAEQATAPEVTAPAAEQAAAPETTAPAAPEATQPTEQAATAEQPAAKTSAEQPAPETTQQVASAPAAEVQQEPAPAKPVAAAVVPAFDTVRVEKTGEAVVAGTAAPGADVALKLDGQEIGRTTANDDGAFVIVLEKPLPSGSGALTLEAKAPGETAATTSAQSVAVIVPEAAAQEALVAVVSPDQPTKVLQKPAAPAPEPAAAPAPAQETQAETPEAPKTPETPAKPAKLVSIDAVDYDAAGNIVFSGQGEQGNTARVYIDNNFIGDAAVGPDGRWTFSGTADVSPGVHTLRVDGLDAKGEVVNRVEVPFFREAQSKVADAAQPAPDQTAASTEAAPEVPAATAETQQPAEAPAAAPQPPREGRVVIQPGNNLWRISRVLYGTGAKYTVLYEANKEQIRNPDLIYPGQVFKTPDVAAKFETVDPRRRDPLKPDENAAAGQQ